MNALAQLAVGIGGVALLMAAWCLVQQRWLELFAPGQNDALAARRRPSPAGVDNGSNDGCASCSSPHCNNKGGP